MTELILEIGKCYVDKRGNKYQAMEVDNKRVGMFCFSSWQTRVYSESGVREGGYEEFDLIAEYKEPVVAMGYLIVHENNSTIVSCSTEELRDQLYVDVPEKMLRVDITVDITNKTADVEVI